MTDKVTRTKEEIKYAISKIEKIKSETSTISAFEGSPRDILDLQILILKHRIIKESLLKDLHEVICKGYCMDWYKVEKTQWFLIGIIEIDELD